MTISANIEAKIEELQKEKEELAEKDPPEIGPKARELKELAISAVLGDRAAFVAYMKLFAGGSTEDLARLIPLDGTENDPDKREARAYLVSNAICAPGTATGLNDNVFDRLDN